MAMVGILNEGVVYLGFNNDYFYIRALGPTVDYMPDGGNYNEVFEEEPADTGEVRSLIIKGHTPEGFVIGDFLTMAVHVHVISQKVKNALEELDLPQVQFLPAVIHDEKGTTYDNYYILHPYKTIKCMHKGLSRWTRGSFDPKRASEIEKLVIDNEKLGEVPLEERRLFGLWENRAYLLFHRTVVDKMTEVSPGGFKAYPISENPYV